ncbi:transporter substrate-binding domain-containing protein [Clostridium algoriphilum]|uniref:ABC transporter substrate-binding protein n=1 Tax=Clostridium algoriphilum TaxID=198347 RepID=UPI001CF1BAE1|nr:transporter substrate-binding domain-containing protein [Clostridium algoriphilum]MCB2292642.1 transporter substrate-binding domain-containing protein [Clostridium algoriphilum]
MKKLLPKKLLTILLVSIFTASLVGCSGTNVEKKDTKATTYTGTLEGALKDYTFKMGTSGTYAPFSYYHTDGKTLVGFDMDFLHELQNILGFKIQDDKVLAMDYSPLTTSVAEGKLDIVMAALCATDARKKAMNFTDTYYNAGLSVIVNKNTSPKEITGIDSIKSGKYKIAVQKGDASHLYLTGANIPLGSIQVHDTITTALESLEQGKVDCMVYDAPGTAYYVEHKKDTNLALVGEPFAKDQTPYAIALSFDACKKNPELLSIMNKAIKKLKDNGTIAKLEKKWCN